MARTRPLATWLAGMALSATLAIILAVALPARADADPASYLRFEADGRIGYGILEGETIHELSGDFLQSHRRTGRTMPLARVRVLPPTVPSKVLAVALNFASHGGSAGAGNPELFAKFPSSLLGTGEPIQMPPDASNLHYEGELVVVIGKKARNISEQEAPAYIFGVTAGNDLSERTWQMSDTQWLRGKASDGFGPVGPVVVTGLDYRDLLIETRLNGEVQQAESTRNLIHSVDRIVSYASRYFTLLPGDLIFTGTPGRTRPVKAGDTIEIRIQSVGILRNRVVRTGN